MKTKAFQSFSVITLLVLAGMGHAQDLPYSSGSTGADGPLDIPTPMSRRGYHASAFHESSGKLIVFGGYNNVQFMNDTLRLTPPHWSTANPITSPSPRYGHGMAYDAARQVVFLFGGYSNNEGQMNDCWSWNGTVWAQETPATKPSARSDHAMVYDSTREEIVLFGGSSGGDETWIWSGADSTWTQKSPAAKPADRSGHAMAYDSARQRVVLFGGTSGSQDETWEWDGTTWLQRSFSSKPSGRYNHVMAYDSVRQQVVLFSGSQEHADTWTYGAAGWQQKQPVVSPPSQTNAAMTWDPVRQKIILTGGDNGGTDTWLWDGENWAQESGANFSIDMASKPDGLWNFTSVNVPAGVTVWFKPNVLNTPVRWLAKEAVTIDGTIVLDGENGRYSTNVEAGNEAKGGPGGYDGGLGGRQFSISGSYIGSAGGGPGGGSPGNQNENGKDGTFNGAYGNTFLQPLIGGSGGGGGSSTDAYNGGNGGAGGGAILIASSRDITVSGHIYARGGYAGPTNNFYGGYGSGGAVRLVADRVLGSGNVVATSPVGGQSDGRIRIEGYFRPLTTNAYPVPSAGPPTDTFAGLTGTALTVAQVAGAGVRQPPQGSTSNPDVIFTQAGPVTIGVTGQNIPNGTPVTLRLATSNGVIHLPATGQPAVTMQDNAASFSATVPAGVGTIQAYATITLAPAQP